MKNNTLKHISFILDGNKRWAEKNKINENEGYKKGIDKIYEIINYCYNNKIKHVTLYLLSTENINRKNNKFFFRLAKEYYQSFIKRIDAIGNIKINIIGEKTYVPENIIKLINKVKLEEKKDSKLILNLAFNYGFTDEIKTVISKVNSYSIENKINIKDIKIDDFFYLNNQPNPDILVRTGGYKRLSNFILKNLIYTEMYFIDTLWPDLSLKQIDDIILNFKKIDRNYGL